MKARVNIKNRKLVFLIIFLTSSLAIAGIHAYTHNLKVTHSLYHSIYWSEIGESYPSVRMGE